MDGDHYLFWCDEPNLADSLIDYVDYCIQYDDLTTYKKYSIMT
jgi:hypothetical protein